MANTTNITTNPVVEAVCFVNDSPTIKWSRVVPYCLIIPLSIIGNAMVVTIVLKNRPMHKTVNFFIVNMSVADLLATVVYMPRVVSIWLAGYAWQVDGIPGLIFCKVAVLNETSIAVTIFTIVIISLDRFFAVVFPLQQFITTNIAKYIILITWLAGVLIAFPQFHGIGLLTSKGQLYCYLDLNKSFGAGSSTKYYTFKIIGLFAVPLVTIVILYAAIMVALLKRRRLVGDAKASYKQRLQRQERTRKKVLKMVSIVVIAFVLCWLMYFIREVLYSYQVNISCEISYLRLLLAHLNSVINPCVYWFCNENFRQGYINLVRSILPCLTNNRIFPSAEILASKRTDGSSAKNAGTAQGSSSQGTEQGSSN